MSLGERTGQSIGPARCPGEIILPNGANLADGLAEDEAVLVALWNNAALAEQLAQVGVARGDLIQAGLLPNPELWYVFSATGKPYRYALDIPLEALWLRPIRVAAASREADRICHLVTQAGLNLIRDTRQAYADLLLAHGRLAVANDALRLRERIAQLANARLQAGDVSVQEEAITKIDALTASQDVARLAFDVALAEERLRNLMGTGLDRAPLVPSDSPPPRQPDLDVQLLVTDALASRPDLLSAGEGIAAAEERLRLTRSDWFRLLGILDGSAGELTGHEFSPGLRVTLPVFHWNGGNIARAQAERDRALWRWQVVRDQITMDVQQAHARYLQAARELEILEGKVAPEVETGVRRAEAAYQAGDTSYLLVLESTRQVLDSRLRRVQLWAELRRAWAELERSVGRRLADPVPPGGIEPLPEARLTTPVPAVPP
jgi:cobalt-zinc-cadmium efflux system outer membrane protein